MFLKLVSNLAQGMAVEEKRVNKEQYKLVLKYIKVIPMLIALCDVLNTITCFLGFDIEIFSFIGGISFLTLAFLYLVSYVFRFCVYHRMFLHYILINNIIGTLEYTIGIPISTQMFITLWSMITGIFLFTILFYHKREVCLA